MNSVFLTAKSPGNFTASKLAWVKEHEPEVYERINKIMLPGDYIAFRMTGEALTSYSGLSEGIFYDFLNGELSGELMDFFGFDRAIIPEPVNSFSVQGYLLKSVADELGLPVGIPVSYRAGDTLKTHSQLNVLEPGCCRTAGTSGDIYGHDQKK